MIAKPIACAATFVIAASLSACSSLHNAHELIPPSAIAKETMAENARKLIAAPPEIFSSAAFSASNGITLGYRLFSPATKAPGKLPLVVVMHGSDGIGSDNRKHLGMMARSWAHPDIQMRFPSYVLAPQVPERSADYQTSPTDGELQSIPGPALTAVLELVEQFAAREEVDATRIYILGFSMGGSGAWNAVALRPRLFAAAVPISGIAPDRRLAAVIAGTPLAIVHGNADTENPIGADRAMFAAMQAVPNATVRFIEYEGLQHTVSPDMLFAIHWREWLFTQRRAMPRAN